MVVFQVHQLAENKCQQPSGYRISAEKTPVFGERNGSAFRRTPTQRSVYGL